MSVWAYLPRWWITVMTNGLMLLMVLIVYVLGKTFIHQDAPIEPEVGEYSVAKGDEAYVIYFKCMSRVREEFEAHVHRTITHQETGESFSLPANEVKFDKGPQNVTRIFYVPKVIKPGKWCSVATMEWRPFMSLVDHKSVGQSRCFEIPK